MRIKHLLLLFIAVLTFNNNPLSGQSQGASGYRYFSPDSLAGFEESAARRIGLEEGLTGAALNTFIDIQKRNYINEKYNLWPVENVVDGLAINSLSNGRIIGGGSTINNAPCVNEGFESGNISGWTAIQGLNTISSCSTALTSTGSLSFPSQRLRLRTTPFNDFVMGSVPNSPFAGSTVIKLNDSINDYSATRISQTYPVTSSNFLYEFAYKAVMASGHVCCNQTYMSVRVIDQNNNQLSCPVFTFAPPPTSGPACSSPGITWSLTLVSINGSTFSVYYNPSWQRYSIDLTNYIGQNVTIVVTVADCTASGHWGYAYFDSNCGQLGVTLNNTTFYPAPVQATPIDMQANCGQNATLTAPAGLAPYLWSGPTGTFNTQSIVTGVAGTYSLQMNPNGACQPILRYVNLTFPPPTTVTASPATVCATGNTSSTLTAIGALSYTWSGGGNGPTKVVTPLATTIYSVTVQTGTCIGVRTVQVSYSADPTVAISNSDPIICAGGTSSLIASGALNYTWSPGGSTNTTNVVSPVATTVYTLTGKNAGGCVDTETTTVTVTTATVISILPWSPNTGTICNGSSISMIALGALTPSWYPTSPLVVGQLVTLTPTVTTNYTVIGGTGSCTNLATYQVTVDQGPPITPVSTPTIICPGNTATLSATAVGAVGNLTWQPSGTQASSIQVIPLVTTNYSVQGKNSNGCVRTVTINQLVAPLPTVVISPPSPTVCIGSALTLTASGGTSYTWTGGPNTNTKVVTPLVNTGYTVTVSNGTCTSLSSVIVTVVPLPNVTASSSTNAVCAGNSVNLTGGGATSYTWMPGSLIGANVTVTPAINTTYTVTGSSGGCTKTATVAITVNPRPTINVSASPASVCPGFCSTLTPSGALTYTSNPSGPYCPLVTTTYSFSGTNGFGCVSTQPGTVTVVVNPSPTINIAASAASICAGSGVTFTASGASTYTWNTGSNSAIITVSPNVTTTYTVTGASALGCNSQKTISVIVVPNPTVGASASPTAICSGASAVLSATGATSYVWNPGGLTGANITVSPPTTTNYTVSGSTAGCTRTAAINLVVNPTPTLTITASTPSVCSGSPVSFTASGANNYTWQPGGLTGVNVTFNPTITTTYTLTGVTAAGCSSQKTVNVIVIPISTITASATPTVICSGSSSTLSASGAGSYTWNPGNLSGPVQIVSPVSTTQYTVTGNVSGCPALQALVTVSVNTAPTLTAAANPTAVCAGSSATLTATGSATSFTWSTGSNLSSIAVTPTSTTVYTVVGASGGCTTTRTVSVVVNPVPTITVTASSLSVCAGNSVQLSASGAATYSWNPGGLTGVNVTVSPVASTTYTVFGTNAGGCTGQNTITIIVVPKPVVTATSAPAAICPGNSATLTANGATTFTWSTGATGSSTIVTPTITTLYTVSGSMNGCTSLPASVTVTVSSAPILAAIIASPSPVCQGLSSNLSTSGALSYTWVPGNLTGSSITVTPAITTGYTVTGSNAAGCTSTRTITVIVYPAPVLNITTTKDTICVGGFAILTASGASSYVWNPGSSSSNPLTVNPVVSTVYTVVGTNSLGCTSQKTIAITVRPVPTINASASPATICRGLTTTLSASGASSYTWNGSVFSSSTVVSPTVTTSYTVVGSNGTCTNQAVVMVTVNALPIVTASASPSSICAGASSTLSAGGGVSYTWNPGGLTSATVTVTPSVTTVYTVSASSAFGCIGSQTVTVTVSPIPVITANASPGTICQGLSSVLSATGAASYVWTPGPLAGANVTVTPSSTTTYTVVGTIGSCTAMATKIVTVNPTPVLSAGASPAAICLGASSTLTITGASTYTWNPGGLSGNNVVVTPNSSTTYTAIGSSAAGCTNAVTVPVTVNPVPSITITPSSNSICAGSCATLSALGATNYTWSPGGSNSSQITVCPPSSSNYTLTGSNGFGCTGTSTINITVSPLPVISIGPSPTVICAGQNAFLVVLSPLSNFTWMPGNLTTNISTVTPASTTVYTLTASNGCTASATRTIVVNPTPTVTATANPGAICPGGTATLTASGGVLYAWTPGPIAGNVVTVSPSTNTTYTVVAANAFSCISSATVNVNVNPLPVIQVTATNGTICSGTSATLTATGGTSYVWSPGGGTGSSIIVSPSGSTVYTVTGIAGTGCSNTATFALAVNPTPTLIASALSPSVCEGFTTALSASGGGSYTWSPGGMIGTPIVVTPTASTLYTVTSTMNGCTGSATVNVNMVPLPVITASANPASICPGSTSTLTASGAVTYTWAPMLVSGSSVTVAPLATTVYTVGGFGANGCPNYTVVTVTILPNPTITASSTSSAVCIGGSATLTASGASTYTWNPGSQTGSNITVSPVVTTVYTVTGSSGGGCNGITTITIAVNPLPVVVAQASPTMVCEGSQVSLTASGALNYTWNPTGLTGSLVTDNPLVTTSYTVTGEDSNGCSNSANVTVVVNPNPTITASASPTIICEGSSVALNAAGANTYTWNPGGQTGPSISDSPLITTTYTVSGTDNNGCVGLDSIIVTVVPNPTIMVTPLNSSICVGSQATLTATGAGNYTWMPSGTNGSVTVESPTISTTYTVIGDNAGLCVSSFTVDVFVNPLPANVTASSSGTITCASQSVNLTGTCTDTNVSYSWFGPLSYSSTIQNPTVTIWGTFTLNVTDNVTGCVATVTVDVATDNSIPLVNATTTGSITCAASSVTLNAANTTTNPGYSWTGPSAFTSTLQTFTVNVPGAYTVVVTDLSSTCTGSAIVSVGVHTAVVTTATITAATCSAGISNNDGTIMVSTFGPLDKFDLVMGSTYTGTATYSSAVLIPTTGIITNNLANPSTTVAFALRIFDSEGCTRDYTLYLVPTDCAVKALGIAKSVLTPSLNADGSYNVTYKVTVKNYGTTPLTAVELNENLSATFPSPVTFSVISPPALTSQGSSLTMNNSFDGVNQVSITNSLSSGIAGGVTDTIQFTVKVTAHGSFGPFNNSIIGYAINTNSIGIRDTSNAGLDPDFPNPDGNPYNNNTPTTLTLTPDVFFGLTKEGSFEKLDNNTFDVTYTVTVHNLGNDTLRGIVVKDSLFDNTIRHPATYVVKSAPVATGSLVANAFFNGSSDINLVDPLSSKMPPGAVSKVTFVINVKPDTVTILRNSAFGKADKSHDPLNPVFVSDSSNAGNNPDVNNNRIWNEPSDNVPTILILPSTHTLFIPQGFSPNGDGINDQFKITGLPETGNNVLTIYNRWGNRVYYHSNYNNTWDGYPNIAGTFGRDKLPQGTYYFILDMKGSGIKPITGYIVLQY